MNKNQVNSKHKKLKENTDSRHQYSDIENINFKCDNFIGMSQNNKAIMQNFKILILFFGTSKISYVMSFQILS